MSFSDFVLNEDDAQKKRQEIENTILAAVKKNIVETIKTEDSTIIKFKIPGRRRDSICETIVALDYLKKVYRGNYRVVYVNIIFESQSQRSTDYIQIDISKISEPDFKQTLLGISEYFAKLLNNPLVQDSKK